MSDSEEGAVANAGIRNLAAREHGFAALLDRGESIDSAIAALGLRPHQAHRLARRIRARAAQRARQVRR